MLATPALPAHGGPIGRSLPPAATPWARHHLAFRGTRILTAAVLSWSGAALFALGALVVPAAYDAGRAELDPGLMGVLGSAAPWLVVLGIANVVAAWGAARDRGWWTVLATWVLAAGATAILAGAVFAVAGRDPFALMALQEASPAGHGLGILASILALQGIAAWGVRRVVDARGLA